jgi:hypothetical protein
MPPMNPRSTAFERSTLTHPDEPTIYCFGGVVVSVLVLKEVDCGFIGGIMVSVLVLKVVDHGFIGGRLVCFSQKR